LELRAALGALAVHMAAVAAVVAAQEQLETAATVVAA